MRASGSLFSARNGEEEGLSVCIGNEFGNTKVACWGVEDCRVCLIDIDLYLLFLLWFLYN